MNEQETENKKSLIINIVKTTCPDLPCKFMSREAEPYFPHDIGFKSCLLEECAAYNEQDQFCNKYNNKIKIENRDLYYLGEGEKYERTKNN